MKFKKMIFAGVMAVMAVAPAATSAQSSTPASNDWEWTDALGRKVRDYTETHAKNDNKFVGLFYWTWHQGKNDTNVEVKNITEVLREYPEAINDYNHPAWGGANRPGEFFWEEPLFGYYETTDPWVLRKHAEMLGDAGVDVVIFDCTNGSYIWEDSFWALLETWDQAQKDGVNTPKVAFMLPFAALPHSLVSLRNLWNLIYSKNKYQNLWFYWKGKPLIMGWPDNLTNSATDQAIANFFSFRRNEGDYIGMGPNSWGWLETYPNKGHYKNEDGTFEQTTVGVAQNASTASNGHCIAFTTANTYGRSFSMLNRFDKRPDGYLYGWNFQEQWNRAIDEIDPEFIFVTGWNEFTSGMWTSAQGWSDPLSFVDQYDWDRSRDCEPNKGWGDKGDVYYAQLVDNIRRFKGMSLPATASGEKTIKLGESGQWDDVKPLYKAYRGNTLHRNHRGYYNKHYVNMSGRNDITGAQVARDADYIYFRVTTDANLTSRTDRNWMMLFIDVDRDKSTGWEGYDFVINHKSPKSKVAIVERNVDDGWNWAEAGEVDYYAKEKVLEIAVPRGLLGLDDDEIDFEFKWSDNMQDDGNPMDFYVNGDVAPGGRFNYHYTTKKTSVQEVSTSKVPLDIRYGSGLDYSYDLESSAWDGVIDAKGSLPYFQTAKLTGNLSDKLNCLEFEYKSTMDIEYMTVEVRNSTASSRLTDESGATVRVINRDMKSDNAPSPLLEPTSEWKKVCLDFSELRKSGFGTKYDYVKFCFPTLAGLAGEKVSMRKVYMSVADVHVFDGIDDVEVDEMTAVKAVDGRILIGVCGHYDVYTFDGMSIRSGYSDGNTYVNISTAGLYIVVTEAGSKKLFVK